MGSNDTNEVTTIEYPSGKLAALTRKKNQIIELLQNDNDQSKQAVSSLLSEFEDKLSVFLITCENIFGVLKSKQFDDSQIRKFEEWVDLAHNDSKCFISKINEWLTKQGQVKVTEQNESGKQDEKLEDQNLDDLLNPNDSISNVTSKKSSASSLRQRIAEEKAKIEAEKNFHQKKIQLEEEMKRQENKKLEMERKLRELEIEKNEEFIANMEKEANKIENKSKASSHNKFLQQHNTFLHQNSNKLALSNVSKSNISKTVSNVKITDLSNNDQVLQILSDQNEVNKMLIRTQDRASLPINEPEIFNGTDLTKYRSFMLGFDALIESKCHDKRHRFFFLLKYTSGEARDLVRSCEKKDSEAAYTSARELLEEEYGNDYLIANAYVRELENWASIDNEDGKALREYGTYLTTCANLMGTMTSLNQLNSTAELNNLMMKLPFKLRDRWRTHSYDLIKKNGVVSFQDFATFVKEQSRIMNQSLFGNISDPKGKGKTTSQRKPSSDAKKKTFTSSVTAKDSKGNAGNLGKRENSNCICCKKTNHSISNCYFFERKDHEDKIQFLKEKGLCFSCLGTSHSSRGCMQRSTCNKCSGKHPTILHRSRTEGKEDSANKPNKEEKKNSKEEKEESSTSKGSKEEEKVKETKSNFITQSVSSYQTGAGTRPIYAALPVKIRVKGSEKLVQTYIGLDTFSSDCFMNEDLLNQLGVKTTESEISLTTMDRKNNIILTKVLNNLEILDLEENESTIIPVIYCKDNWPFDREDSPKPTDKIGLSYLNHIPFKYINESIGILVGLNMTEILLPLQIIRGPPGMPYATLHKFGWTLNGCIESSTSQKRHCHRIKLGTRNTIENQFEQLCANEFQDNYGELEGKSIEDEKWERKVWKSIRKKPNNHYEVGLPFKDEDVTFPCNRSQALGRIMTSKRRLQGDEKFFSDYKKFMDSMIENDFAEKVTDSDLKTEDGKAFYLIHHGIYHKQKNKLRVVFDASLKFKGVSLNSKLLQGPDLTSSLLGVLLRFRQGLYAFSGDIRSMFYQISVPEIHRNYLRYLWFPDGCLEKEPEEYRVKVHIFGAVSSPSISNFVLRYTAKTDEAKRKYSEEAIKSVQRNFYVDDLFKSVNSEDEAIILLDEIRKLVLDGGFTLTGLSSNSRRILDTVDPEDWSKDLQGLDILCDDLPYERALGLIWNSEKDTFGIRLNISEQPLTKRGILSTIFSIYDPFGIAIPAVLPAKRVFQLACSYNLEWDTIISKELEQSWSSWLDGITSLRKLEINRCLIKDRNIKEYQLHVFCDGSTFAFAACAYLRCKDEKDNVHCVLLMAKSRLVPLGRSTLTTVPRIELNGAKLAVNLKLILCRELESEIDSVHFWTDSTTVINYLNCETKRFQRFVSNRVAYIRNNSSVEQWHFVNSELNPADLGSRGCSASTLLKSTSWFEGPKFLCEEEDCWPKLIGKSEVSANDPEVKKEKLVLTSHIEEKDSIKTLLESSSSWFRTKIRVAWILRLRQTFLGQDYSKSKIITIRELRSAENAIWCYVQEKAFRKSLENLQKNGKLMQQDKLVKLNPFIDKNGLLRVGGRLTNYDAPFNIRHPIILPKNFHVTELLMRSYHKMVGHLGRKSTHSSLRQNYWIIGGNNALRKLVHDCITCRKLNAKPSEQLMGELPEERVNPDLPPFSSIGIDCFGPYYVTRGRGRVREKRYGLLFSCLTSRAVHIEVLFSLDIDSFINAFRRFQSRRGQVKLILSDNGTNFVGAEKEIRNSIREWNEEHIEHWLQQEEIEWKFQPPSASHFGGHFERLIRSIRKVLNGLLNEQPMRFNDETLNTLMCEVECILNSRPLTEVSDDPNDLEALTPNHILLLRSQITFPPGLFKEDDLYIRKRWKQVQHLADIFWSRWKKEYLPLLQQRNKWTLQRNSHQKGDLVLLVDQMLPRNCWSMGKIEDIFKDDHGNVRVVDVKISKLKGAQGTTVIRRPISKIVLLKSASEL